MQGSGVDGHPYVVDGLRVDRAEDGFAPLGDGFALRNAYLSNIRDDCVENDFFSGGRIEDSLLDGCYTGISVDSTVRTFAPSPELVVLDRR